jgi:pyruvate ferredoxin oxidoreductase beta subunit
VSKIRRQVPVEDYLRPQRRFAHLFKKGAEDRERIDAIQRMADANIKKYGLLAEEDGDD